MPCYGLVNRRSCIRNFRLGQGLGHPLAIYWPNPHLERMDPITRLNAALEGRYRIERKLGERGMAGRRPG